MNDGITQPSPSVDILLQQFKTLWILLQRPIVQRQLLALFGIILASWVITMTLDPYIRRRFSGDRERGIRAVTYIDFSVLTLIMGYLSVSVLGRQGFIVGLLADSLVIFWFVLVYQVVLALLSLRLGSDETNIYRSRILLPVLVFLIVTRLFNNFVGSLSTLANFPIFDLFDITFTVGQIFGAIFVLYIFITLAWLAQEVIVRTLGNRTSTTPGVTNTVTTIGRYAIIGFGILFAFRALGFDLSTFALIGGGLSIGIGFGLQTIVSNFFSGLILLFEQSLRPGDIVKISDEIGVVERLNIRSTVVRTYDNVEIIVPNENFLSSQFTTYTKTDRLVRVPIEVGVSYDSDPEQVRELLLEAANGHPDVLDNPTPIVQFIAFGDSSLNFRLLGWISEAFNTPRVKSDLHFLVWKVLAENKIEIPFPQRDLNLGSGWERMQQTGKREQEAADSDEVNSDA